MPSYNKIARIHDVALSTAQKAIGVLRDEGLVQSINGQATYVIATTPHNHTDVVGMFTDLNRRIDTLEKTVRDLQKIMNPRTREPARSNRSQHG
ncbi:regulatory GntR family protein [Herbihabitans rhizosphaerae]|uniref:Regulatory GntR family protein n=2 Tax=Herbihabitans rhizosphaerae TaxID=1872711 RepID=A0A4Q7KCE9_9PSEU|nr:regulatory GntR family protein [Herbihabitans rhizosphaerae]